MLISLSRLKNALRPGFHQSDLSSLLRGLASELLYSQRVNSFKGLIDWLRLPIAGKEDPRTIRYRFLIKFLERNPEEAKHFIDFFQDFTRRGNAIRLLSLTGVSENHNFFSEVTDRLTRKLLPLASYENDLAEIFQIVFTETEDALWIERNQQLILPPLFKLFEQHGIGYHDLIHDLHDAMIIVTSQIASLGTNKEIRRRLESTNLASSHFIKLGRTILSGAFINENILLEISHCREHIQRLRLSLEVAGVSVNLIYQMERLSSLLDRLESLVYLQVESNPTAKNMFISRFIAGLIRDEISHNGIGEFVREHLHLITRKIVERAGEKGDYYIVNTPEEKSHLFKAGAWAGVLTAFAALFKSLIAHQKYPYLNEGLFFFINYLVIFLIMQRWHLALSSKLPAYTAAALSRKFESFKETKQIYDVVSEIQKIFRSQMVAAVGNIVWVIPACLIIDWSWFLFSGHHLYSNTEALVVIRKHDLLRSGTLFYSFITGIFLWLSSIIAGAVENWLVFIRFPFILKESPLLNRLFPKKKLDTFARSLPPALGSMTGNIAISAFLAFPIVLGSITGLPLDIRHVTLSTGSLSFAFNSLHWNIEFWPLFMSMCMSILVMGVLNFGVSFYCALKLAAISQDIENRHLRVMLKFILFKRFKDLKS